MQHRMTLIATAVMLAQLAPIPAQATEPAVPQRAAGVCSEAGGFGFRFGQAEAEVPRAGLGTQNSRFTQPPSGDWAPFNEFEAVFTAHSRKLHRISATARFSDEAEARRFFQSAAAAIEVASLKADGQSDGDSTILFAPPSAGPDEGYRVEIDQTGASVSLTCFDQGLFRQAMSEALGRVRLAAAPEPPKIAPPNRPSIDACASPERSSETISGFESKIEEVVLFAQAANRHGDALVQWKGQQLVDKGVWTEAQEAEFAAELLSDPKFSAYFTASLERLNALFGPLKAIGEARNAGDKPAECKAAVAGVNAMHDLVESVFQHWDYTIQRYDAVAKSKGVTLI